MENGRNGEWGMGNGEWGMGNGAMGGMGNEGSGEWGMGWGMGNGEWGMRFLRYIDVEMPHLSYM